MAAPGASAHGHGVKINHQKHTTADSKTASSPNSAEQALLWVFHQQPAVAAWWPCGGQKKVSADRKKTSSQLRFFAACTTPALMRYYCRTFILPVLVVKLCVTLLNAQQPKRKDRSLSLWRGLLHAGAQQQGFPVVVVWWGRVLGNVRPCKAEGGQRPAPSLAKKKNTHT